MTDSKIPFFGRFVSAWLSKPTVLVLLWVSVLTVHRLVVITQPYLYAFFDEAYYYHWSQDLAFGYYSKPPFVAWLISLSTAVLGVSTVSIKVLSPFCYALVTLSVFWITRRVCHERAAVFAALVFSTAPLVGFNSLFITTDAPLFVFWALTILFALRYEASPSLKHAISLGLALGCGMLSKYTFAILPLGLLSYVAFYQRHLFFVRYTWIAIGVGLLLFGGNVYWNLEHGFVAAKHTQEIAQLDGQLFNFPSFFAFLGTQFVIFGVVSSIAIFSNRRSWVLCLGQSRHLALILWVTLPILVVIALQSLLSRAFANWAGPFMIGASVFAGIAMSRMKLRYCSVAVMMNLTLLTAFYHWPSILSIIGVEQTKRNSPYIRVAGWTELADIVAETVHDNDDDVYLLSNSRELLAYIGFYNHWNFGQLLYWYADESDIRNHYDLKNNIRLRPDLHNRPLLLVTKPGQADAVLPTFASVEFVAKVTTDPSSGVERSVEIYRVQGFYGYE